MYTWFLPLPGEEVFVIVASPTGSVTSLGEHGFSVNAVAGEALEVKREPNPTRGFKVKAKLLEKGGGKTEVLVNGSAVVRPEYLSDVKEGDLKVLIAMGAVPIVSGKRAWKKFKDKGAVNVVPGGGPPGEGRVAAEDGASEEKLQKAEPGTPPPSLSGSKPGSRAWKRLLEKETPEITDLYDLREVLGKGNYGTTRIAVDKKTKRRYACKSISKRKLSCQEDIDDVRREIELLHHLGGHPNVIGFKGAFEDRIKIHLVMELCTGGELFDRIVARGHYSERDAAHVVRSMLRVVSHCHALGVIHRDLKPENFLLADRSENPELKAIDFGLSVYFKEGQVMKELAGSAFYIAPEVLKKEYSKECDIWSCGVILYILLSGMPPFFGDTEAQIFNSIAREKLDLESEPWPTISTQAKDVVKKLLVRDPHSRATADEILQHEWMKENGVASDKPLGDTVIDRIKGFAAMNKLKKEALLVIARNLPKEEIEGLHQMFKGMDTSSAGVISVADLKEALKKRGEMIPEEDLSALLQNVDVDGSGSIDYEEFLAATMNTRKMENDEQLMKAFEHFDTDGSGTISLEELQEALKKYGESEDNIIKLVKEVDKDGDGQIDYEEFRDMMLAK